MPTESISSSTPADGAQAAGEAGASEKPSGTAPPMSDSIGNIGNFKTEYPEIWKKMMITWATEMTNKMRRDQEKIKKLSREGQKR